MKIPKEWIEIRKSDNKNRLVVKDGRVKWNGKWKITLKNHEKIKTIRFSELGEADSSNSATIFLSFVNDRGLDEENQKDDVQYWFVKREVTREELEKQESDANMNWLFEKNILNNQFGNTGKDIAWELKSADDKIILQIKDKNNPNSTIKKIRNVQVQFNFFLTDKINIRDVLEPKKPIEEPWLTRRKIAFFVLITATILLIIYFRKIIWSWMKGENKQKKNSEIDIF